jgi:adenosylcobyric acid synthase
MGTAQVVQAWASGLEPDVRMNPILLMPTSHTGSEVIVMGHSRGIMQGRDYFARKQEFFPTVAAAYNGLAAVRDSQNAGQGVMLLEGAGSPAEINLRQHDIVNMRMAAFAKARVLLIGDIDRGGVFAGLVGTLALLAPWERDLVDGLIINKFRGDISLLEPGLADVEELTGKPVLGVIPHLENLGLPEEDSLSGRGRGNWDCMTPDEFAAFRQNTDAALDRLAGVIRQNLNLDYIYKNCLALTQ